MRSGGGSLCGRTAVGKSAQVTIAHGSKSASDGVVTTVVVVDLVDVVVGVVVRGAKELSVVDTAAWGVGIGTG
jgi:hypothetical protein